MKNTILLLFILIVSKIGYSQNTDGSTNLICKVQNETQDTSILVVNRFKRKYTVSVKVNGLRVGRSNPIQIIRVNHSEKCKLETGLIQLNDSIAIQVQLAQSANNGEKELYRRLRVYSLNDKCWKLVGGFTFDKITTKNIRSSNMSIGGHNGLPYVELDNVLIRVE